MRLGGWVVRRTRVRTRLLAALTVLTFGITLLVTGIVGLAQKDSVTGVRDYLSAIDDTAASSQFLTSLSSDPKTQSGAVASVSSDVFSGLPVQSFRRVKSLPYTLPVPATGGGQQEVTIRLGTYDDLASHATVTAGKWPESATGSVIGVAVPAATARAWKLAVGDTIAAKDSTGKTAKLQVTGVFTASGGPFWRDDVTLVNGQAVADPSPTFVVADTALTDDFSPQVTWTFQVVTDHISTDQVALLATAMAAFPDAIRANYSASVNGSLFGGSLAGSLSVLQSSLDAAVVAQPLPIMLIIAFGLVMVLQIGRLVTDDRRSETALLKSRGLSARRLSIWAAVETFLFAAPGALIGLAVASPISGVPAAGWWTALAATVVAILACAFPAWRDGAALLIRSRIDDSGRSRSVVAGGVLVLLAAAAAFAVWRFRRGGADAVTDVDGRRVLDPAVLLAPPVTLIALAAGGLVLFGLATTILERLLARRSTALPTVLPARQLARRRQVFGAAVLMIGLAVGGVTVAAGYAKTAAVHQQQTAQLANGTDVRIVTAGQNLSPFAPLRDPLTGYRALPAVTASGPVLRLDTTAGDTPITVVGIGATSLRSLITSSPQFDGGAVAAALTHPPTTKSAAPTPVAAQGISLPSGTKGLTLTAAVKTAPHESGGNAGPESLEVRGTVWLITSGGALVPAYLGAAEATFGTTSKLTLAVTLPATAPGTRLAGLDVEVPSAQVDIDYTVTMSLTADTATGGSTLDATGWAAQQLSDDGDQFASPNGSSLAFSGTKTAVDQFGVKLPATSIRLTPKATAPVPVVVTASLATKLQLRVGDLLSTTVSGASIRAQVAAVSPQIPGFGGPAVILADLPTLNASMLHTFAALPATDELWLASSNPVETANAAGPVAGQSAIITLVGAAADDALLKPAVQALWWGTAGALLLAAMSVLLVIATLSRSRRAEVAVLRAIGVSAASQAAMRRRELWTTVLPAWVFGLAAGFGTAALIVPGLARQAVAGSTANPLLAIQWPLWAALFGAHVLLVVLAIWWHGNSVRRHAASADPREVTA